MKTYLVSIPITGRVSFEVQAEDDEAAERAAWDAIDDGEEGDVEWEYTKQIVRGNCFSGMQNEVEVSVVDDGDPSPTGSDPKEAP